jgi:hypothetical protein
MAGFSRVFGSEVLAGVSGEAGSVNRSLPHASQSSPKSSDGCAERSFEQAIESVGQYKSQPQQMRSG